MILSVNIGTFYFRRTLQIAQIQPFVIGTKYELLFIN